MQQPIAIIGESALDALVVGTLDFRIAPLHLPGESLDGTSNLGPALLNAHGALCAYLMTHPGDALLISASLRGSWQMMFDASAIQAGSASAINRGAMAWLAQAVWQRLGEPEFSPLGPLEGSRVWRAFPALRGHCTGEGLVRLEASLEFDTEGIYLDDSIIPYHPYLGISRSNSPESDLHALLCDHARRSAGNVVAMAVDGRCFMPKDKLQIRVLEDYWHGMPFRRADLDDPYAVGSTVYSAPSLDTSREVAAACMFAGIARTDFYWKCKDGVKTFMAEEVVANTHAKPRFLHAEYDLKSRIFRHIDGAVMLYAHEDAEARRQPTCVLPRSPKATTKPKLFRIDGTVSVDDWAKILCLAFRGNPLVHQYLAGSTEASPPAPGQGAHP